MPLSAFDNQTRIEAKWDEALLTQAKFDDLLVSQPPVIVRYMRQILQAVKRATEW